METDNLTPLISLRDLVRWAASEFSRNQLVFGHGTDNSLDEALALALHVTGLDYPLPDSYLDSKLSVLERQQMLKLIQLRIDTRKPLAYLTGKAWFAGYRFYVDENVLVPRSPIAELIGEGYYPWLEPARIHRVLDLCSGSGCIGIATALALPHSQVLLSDISPDALAVAQRNLELHGLTERVAAAKSDLFDNLSAQQFDLIVSNPPYVSGAEYAQLPAEYHCEPKIGLEAGQDGMDLVARILRQAADFLVSDGMLIVEVGASAELLMRRYPGVNFQWIEFEHGGDGVFLISRQELLDNRDLFTANS